MSHSPAFAPFDRLFASHSPEIARLDELVEPSETRGMPLEREIASCTSQLARLELEGMPRELEGMSHSPPLVSHSLRGKAVRARGNVPRDPLPVPQSLRQDRPEPLGVLALGELDSPRSSHYYMYIRTACPGARSRGSMPREGSRDLWAARLRRLWTASSPQRGIPGRRRRFFDKRSTRGNGSGAVPSGPPYSGGLRCGRAAARPESQGGGGGLPRRGGSLA